MNEKVTRVDVIEAALEEAESNGNPETTFDGYVSYDDVRFLLGRVRQHQESIRRLQEMVSRAENTAADWMECHNELEQRLAALQPHQRDDQRRK